MLAPLLLGLLIAVRPARAAHGGCPNLCEISVTPVNAASALPTCASVQTYGDDCDCGLLLTLKNLCDAPIRVVDFSFYTCVKAGASEVGPCSTLEPGFEATALFPFPRASGTGQKPTHLHLQIADVDYMVDVVTNVGGFRSSGCAIEHRAGSCDAGTAVALIAAMLVLRRRRSPPG